MANMSKEQIIEKVAAAGLLEFGADRTPVAAKWEMVEKERQFQKNPIRVVAALNNADMNGALLALLKADPEKVFEGMQIAATAIDAEEKWLVLPEAEAAYAEEIADKAAGLGIAVKCGLVNKRESAGSAFHHIETMCALADLCADKAEAVTYMAVAKEGKTSDLVKVAFGTKVADVITAAMGTDAETVASENRAIAIGTKLYDMTAMDKVIEADTNIGNGVITLYDAKCCIVDQTMKQLLAERKHSCGKCTFCREGIIQLHTMAEEITQGQGKKGFIDMMTEIGEAMVFSTPCTMGETASDFAMGALQYFGDEFEEHIKKKKCKNNVCNAFMSIYIDPNECQGCEECADVCPADAIEGKSGFIHMIDEFECTKCGKCIAACENEAIVQTTGRVPKLPNRLTKVGKFKKR